MKLIVKMVFLVIMLLAMSQQALCAPVEVHDAWHNSHDEFKIVADTIEVVLFNNYDSVFVKRNGESLIVDENACSEDAYYMYCYEEHSFDADKKTIDDKGEIEPGFRIRIYRLDPELEITETSGEISVGLDESKKVRAVIKNNGAETATNVEYTEKIPDGIEALFSDSSLTLAGGRLRWSGNINKGKNKTIEYFVNPTRYGRFNLSGEVSYSYGTSEKTVKTKTITVACIAPFEISAVFAKDRVDVNEPADFQVRIKNNIEKTITVKNLSIIIPPEGTVTSSPDSKNGREFLYSGNIGSLNDVSLDFKYSFSKGGTYTIKIKYTTSAEEKEYAGEIEESITVVTPEDDDLEYGQAGESNETIEQDTDAEDNVSESNNTGRGDEGGPAETGKGLFLNIFAKIENFFKNLLR